MKRGHFRPCIDIHDGKVKQIVGGTLRDESDGDGTEKNATLENFTSEYDAAYYAKLYKQYNLIGGHIILLAKSGTKAYDDCLKQAESALKAYPNALQIGGGVTDENAKDFLKMGASKVIVTSFVFKNGEINRKNLNKICSTVPNDKLVLDLSVRQLDDDYYIATERWQNISNVKLDLTSMLEFSGVSSEFLIHAADVEGKRNGIDRNLVNKLTEFANTYNFPITYAGGVKNMQDVEYISHSGLDFTVGSALDLFGGDIKFTELAKYA
jgi:phosphoribosylformimino-5-aminoimidazole carboxamide ribotide isomerase